MTLCRVCTLLVVGALLAACEREEGGTPVEAVPLAGLRYINAVPDTGAMDLRIIDIVGYAPNTVAATFRTGGNPQGITTTLPPPYQGVRAGTRRIRVFMSGTDPAIATTVMFDTSYTFEANTNYTFFLYGYARVGSSPRLNALITRDDAPTPAAGRIAVRTVNLAPGTTAGAASLDGWVVTQTTTALSGAPTISGQQFLGMSAYTSLATGTYKVSVTASGTTTPILFQANMPPGTVGTATANPIAGTSVEVSVLTAVIFPPSVVGSRAPQGGAFTTGGLLYLTDRRPPNTAP